MASTLDLYIDTSSGNLIDGGSVVGGAIPILTRNDSYNLRLRLLEKSAAGAFNDIDTSGTSLKVGIGNIEDSPTDGSYLLTINGITSSAIAYNATAISVYTAISNNVSTVSIYGADSFGSYLLTATQPNTAMSFGADSFTLFPASSVIINTRRNPATAVYAQQVVKLVRDPIVYADTFINAPTADQITLTKIADGGIGQNTTWDLSFGQQVVGGLYALNWGGTSTTGIAPFASATSVQAQINSGINTITSNMTVKDNGKGGYTLQFVGRLSQTVVATPLLLDASGVNFLPLKQTTLTINTSGVEDAFASSGEDKITPTIEIEITKNGTPKTIYQGSVSIRKDLITTGAVVPGDQASYYTKAESNALFFPSVCGGFNFTAGALLDGGAVTAINYNTRNLLDASGNNAVSWGDGVQFQSAGLGFYGATPIIKPTNTDLINAVSSLGLIGSGVTYGTITFPGFDGNSATTFTFTAPTIVLPTLASISMGTSGLKIGTTTGQRVGFFNAAPVAQPVTMNVISALTNLGLIASSVTLGVITGFISDSATNVDATNRKLFRTSSNALGVDYGNGIAYGLNDQHSINYGQRALKVSSGVTSAEWSSTGVTFFHGISFNDNSSLANITLPTSLGTKIGTTTSQKLAFYNSTPIVQPSNTNVVSALQSLGLISSTVTIGSNVSGYVADSATNINATGRALVDASSVTAVNYGTRQLIHASGSQAISFGAGLAFSNTPLGLYGTTPTAQPSNINVVSGLINVGLIASGTTYGVLPQSPRTVTTLTSVTFGTLAGTDQHYRDVVVTGAEVNDIVLIGLPSAVSAGIVIQGVAYKANTVCLSATHADTGSVALNTATYRITVIGY
jgi:hypothetical protein